MTNLRGSTYSGVAHPQTLHKQILQVLTSDKFLHIDVTCLTIFCMVLAYAACFLPS